MADHSVFAAAPELSSLPHHTPHAGGFRWAGVPILDYKEEGNHFKAISRQVLFPGGPKLEVELRYFEIAPGGHSTLERHDHLHSVMILCGCGHVLIGEQVRSVAGYDLLHIPSHTWHQFRAAGEAPFGFLCQVNTTRDRPERPDARAAAELLANPAIAPFIRL